MSRTRWQLGYGLALLVGLAACEGSTEPRASRQVAVISHYSDGPYIEAPDTVLSGIPFEVRVRTYGGGCVSPGDTEVATDGRVVSLRPFDINSGHEFCTDDLGLFTHRVTASIDGAGPIELLVYGLERPADTMIVVEHRVLTR